MVIPLFSEKLFVHKERGFIVVSIPASSQKASSQDNDLFVSIVIKRSRHGFLFKMITDWRDVQKRALKGWITVQDKKDWRDVRSGGPWLRVGGGFPSAGEATRQRPGKIIEKMRAALPRGLTSAHFLWKELFFDLWQPYLFLDNAPLGQSKVHDSFKGSG